MVFLELVTCWRRATWPTKRSPFLLTATTDGVVRLPSLLAIISGLPDCMTAMAELVVPRSIPIILPIELAPFAYVYLHCKKLALACQECQLAIIFRSGR